MNEGTLVVLSIEDERKEEKDTSNQETTHTGLSAIATRDKNAIVAWTRDFTSIPGRCCPDRLVEHSGSRGRVGWCTKYGSCRMEDLEAFSMGGVDMVGHHERLICVGVSIGVGLLEQVFPDEIR